MVHFQEGIFNANKKMIMAWFTFKKEFSMLTQNDNGMVHSQEGIFNANTDHRSIIILTSHT